MLAITGKHRNRVSTNKYLSLALSLLRYGASDNPMITERVSRAVPGDLSTLCIAILTTVRLPGLKPIVDRRYIYIGRSCVVCVNNNHKPNPNYNKGLAYHCAHQSRRLQACGGVQNAVLSSQHFCSLTPRHGEQRNLGTTLVR